MAHIIGDSFTHQQEDISEPINFVHSIRNLEPWLQVFRRACDLGHGYDPGLGGFSSEVMDYIAETDSIESEAPRTLVPFLISHGADIECPAGIHRESAILHAAQSGNASSLLCVQVLWETALFTKRKMAWGAVCCI